ncbi:DUF2141 domain-containing protein [Sphingomonas bacterium]|uniref:DUF2141 domain-containing protein n=1 Tax=Sphingomonas bacterium TaxID=1895847 RepID=UPI0020C5B501|nr:DUF2141 domain-containing protein [Sphingomonas bacterium]
MLKLPVRFAVPLIGLALPVTAAASAVMGPRAGDCARSSGKSAILVKVVGLKSREGVVRVQSYGGEPAGYFDKGTYLERVEVAPVARDIEVCVPVPKAGTYAISVRHTLGGGVSMKDGAGFSGNPNMSLMDALFRRKPPASEVQVRVSGIARVSVTMNYVQDGQLKPIALAGVAHAE